MDPVVVVNGAWLCEHEGGHTTKLHEHERLEKPPHYVICPDCGTHWIVVKPRIKTLAYPVIVPMVA